MCIIFFSYCSHPQFKLILAANRDEFYERPTTVANFWEDRPDIFAGRDLLRGGTWLGANRNGRLAGLTNIHVPDSEVRISPISRGEIVRQFLEGKASPEEYVESLRSNREQYEGFNVIVLDIFQNELWYYNNKQNPPAEQCKLRPGTYSVSNALLDSPWYKLERGKALFSNALVSLPESASPESIAELLTSEVLSDRAHPAEEDLVVDQKHPDDKTPIWVHRGEHKFGTRANTVILVDYNNRCFYYERSLASDAFTDHELPNQESQWKVRAEYFQFVEASESLKTNETTSSSTSKTSSTTFQTPTS